MTATVNAQAVSGTVRVADGVYAHVSPGGACAGNAGFVVGETGVTLIDTGATPALARELRSTVSSVARRLIRTIVNTHSHGDHNAGNSLYGPDVRIVAHERARAEMAAGSGRLPDQTFGEGMVLYQDDTRLELRHYGPGHTTGDTVVWLPERRVVFAGDLVVAGGTPFVLGGSVAGALYAVARLRELDVDTVVPGHGPVCGPAVFDDTVRYLRWLQELAIRGLSAGWTPVETARRAGLGEFAGWRDAERGVANLHRAFAEARGCQPGAQLDVASIFAEMLAFGGDELPRSA